MAEVGFDLRATGGNAEAEVAKLAQRFTELANAEEAARRGAQALAQVPAIKPDAVIPAQFATNINGGASAVQNLRFQMFDIGQSLAGGMNPLMVLTQQGPQVAQALGQASASGMSFGGAIKGALGPVAALGPALGVVGAAVAALGAVYLVLASDLEEATAKMEAQAATADRVAAAADKWSKGLEGLHTDIKLATGELDKWDVKAQAYEAQVRSSSEELAKFHAEQVAAAQAALVAAQAERDGASLVTTAMGERVDAAARAVSATKAAQAAFAERVQAEVDSIPIVIAAGMAEEERAKQEREAAEASAAAARRRAEAARQAAAAERAIREHEAEIQRRIKQAEDAVFGGERVKVAASAYQTLANELDGLIPANTLTDAQRLADILARIQEAEGLKLISPEQAAALRDAAERAGGALASTPSGGGAAGAVGAALSNPLGAIASLHPIVAAVVAGVQSAGSMRDGRSVFTDVAELVNSAMSNLDTFVGSALDAVVSILENAPGALVRAIPGIVAELATLLPDLIAALAEMIPDVIIALAQAIPAMLPDLIAALASAFIATGPLLFTTIVVALIDAFTDPAFYEAIANGFIAGMERLIDNLGDLVGNIVPGDGGGFLTASPTAQAAGKSGDIGKAIEITASDIWTDFTTFLGVEDGAQGRR